MRGTTTGEDIFECVNEIMQKYDPSLSKSISVAT